MSNSSELVRAFKVDGNTYTPFSTSDDPVFSVPGGVYNPRIVKGQDEIHFILQHVDKRFTLDETIEFDAKQHKFITMIMDARREKRRSNAVLIGKPGSGKTTTMSKIANLAIFQDHPVVMFSDIPSGSELKEWFHRFGETPVVFIIDEFASKQKISTYNKDKQKEKESIDSDIEYSFRMPIAMSKMREHLLSRDHDDCAPSAKQVKSIVDNAMRTLLSDATWAHHTVLFSLFDYSVIDDIASLVEFQLDLNTLGLANRMATEWYDVHSLQLLKLLGEDRCERFKRNLLDRTKEPTPADLKEIEKMVSLSAKTGLDLETLLDVSVEISCVQ